MTETLKRCSRCHGDKPLNDFPNSSATTDGKQYWCKSCFKVTSPSQRSRARNRQRRRLATYRQQLAEQVAKGTIIPDSD